MNSPTPVTPEERRIPNDERRQQDAALAWLARFAAKLIWREVQTCLDEQMIQDAIFFATGHDREPSEIRKYSSRAIVSIEPEQGAGLWELVRAR
jgi:hypothetical protein